MPKPKHTISPIYSAQGWYNSTSLRRPMIIARCDFIRLIGLSLFSNIYGPLGLRGPYFVWSAIPIPTLGAISVCFRMVWGVFRYFSVDYEKEKALVACIFHTTMVYGKLWHQKAGRHFTGIFVLNENAFRFFRAVDSKASSNFPQTDRFYQSQLITSLILSSSTIRSNLGRYIQELLLKFICKVQRQGEWGLY